MTTFTAIPSTGVNLTSAFKVNTAQFGDGYSQRVADGINANARSWSVSFTNQATAIDAIQAFLDTEAGVTSFTWVPPVGYSGKWLCESYSRSIDDFDNETLSATFTEVFGE